MTTHLHNVAFGIALSALATVAHADTDFVFTESDRVDADHIIVFASDAALTGKMAAELDDEAGGGVAKALSAADFGGGFGETLSLYGIGDAARVTVIGTGDEALTLRQLHDLGGHVAMAAGASDSVAVMVDTLDTSASHPAAELAAGYGLGSYSFTTYKSDAEESDQTVTFVTNGARAAGRAFDSDHAYLVEGVNMVRDLGNEPGKSVYPEEFVQRVRTAFRGVPGVKIKVYGNEEMERLNMGAITGVGRGSEHDPRMMIIEYMGGDRGEAPVALVGKGITFDTGGISLKPNNGQWLMKSDLSGAAAVAGTLFAAASRDADVNVVGIMPLAENMPDGRAIRPGDVLTTYNGTTIEVMSTDAEGRLLLADAVAYAQDKYEPELLVDIATLTGSAGRALSDEYAAVITRDFGLAQEMMAIGERSGEDVWPLPLHPNHYDQIKSDIADIKSTAGNPGASIGAAVVGTFVDEDQAWVHLDIAGVDWRDSATPTMPKGHAGWGVRFMSELLRSLED